MVPSQPVARKTSVGEVIRKMFAYAVKWAGAEDNPFCNGIPPADGRRRDALRSRKREIQSGTGVDTARGRHAARGSSDLCMLTGARVGSWQPLEDFTSKDLVLPAASTTSRAVFSRRARFPMRTGAIRRQRRIAVFVQRSHGFFPGGCAGQPVPGNTAGSGTRNTRRNQEIEMCGS